MQIKTTNGTMIQVDTAQLQRAYKMLPNKFTVSKQGDTKFQELMQQACHYKNKAAWNIKRIVCAENALQTQDDVKQALTQALMHHCPWDIADAIYQAMQFQAARFYKKMLKMQQE